MPPRPRRVVAGGALLLVLGGVVSVYRRPADIRGGVTPSQAVTELSAASHAQVAWLDDRAPENHDTYMPVVIEGQPNNKLRTKSDAGAEPATKRKPEAPCDKQSPLHDRCSNCRSGSPGDGGLETVGGLCREHCSRQGTGYCGGGDNYVNGGLDCRPCRRWVPGAETTQSPGRASAAQTSVSQGDGTTSLLLADDRIDAVCFAPATAVDGHSDSLSGTNGCLGGDPCPTFATLAIAQAACSRDSRCAAVALRVHDANLPTFELRGSAAKPELLSTLTEYDKIPDVVMWRVADRSAITLLIARISCNQKYLARVRRFQPTFSLSMPTDLPVQLRRP